VAVAGTTPTATVPTKIGKMQSAGCRLCRIAREAQCESSDGLLADTHGHINSTGCKGMPTTVTAAHLGTRSKGTCMKACILHKSQEAGLNLSCLTKKSNMSTLWQRKEFLRICNNEDLTEKTQDIEVTMPVKKNQETRSLKSIRVFLRKLFLGQATG